MRQQKHDFIKIVEANQGLIKGLCRAYFTSYETRKDVFQDIVLQLWKSFGTFRGESEVSTWIYKVALNTILGKLRKDKKTITTEALGAEDLMLASAHANDDLELLHMVLRALTGLDKAIVILYLEGYKNKEISQILDITPTNVSTRLNRIKEDMKSKFRNLQYEPGQP